MKLKQEYEIDKEAHYKPKKYVIKIFPENIKKVESLDIGERDQFINDAIAVYLNQHNVQRQQIDFLDKIKKTIYQMVCLIVLFALLGAVARFLIVYSDSNNAQMENNFQRLFDNYHLK